MPTPISNDFYHTLDLVTSKHSPASYNVDSGDEMKLLVASTRLELARAIPALADARIWRAGSSFSSLWGAASEALREADVQSAVRVWQVASALDGSLAMVPGTIVAIETITKMRRAIDTIHTHAHTRTCALVAEGRVNLDDLPAPVRAAVRETQREQDNRAAQRVHLEKVTGSLSDLNPLDAAVKPAG